MYDGWAIKMDENFFSLSISLMSPPLKKKKKKKKKGLLWIYFTFHQFLILWD